jgi:hypothetical protein
VKHVIVLFLYPFVFLLIIACIKTILMFLFLRFSEKSDSFQSNTHTMTKSDIDNDNLTNSNLNAYAYEKVVYFCGLPIPVTIRFVLLELLLPIVDVLTDIIALSEFYTDKDCYQISPLLEQWLVPILVLAWLGAVAGVIGLIWRFAIYARTLRKLEANDDHKHCSTLISLAMEDEAEVAARLVLCGDGANRIACFTGARAFHCWAFWFEDIPEFIAMLLSLSIFGKYDFFFFFLFVKVKNKLF